MTTETSAEPQPPAARRAPPNAISRFARLTLKELRETLRDRRTIVTLLLMPVLVYPVLGIALQQFALSGEGESGEVVWRIASEDPADVALLKRVLDEGDRQLQREPRMPPLPDANPAIPSVKSSAATPLPPNVNGEGRRPRRTIEVLAVKDLEEGLRQMDIDVGVSRVSKPADADDRAELIFKLSFRANMPLSRQVAEYIETRLRAYNESQWRGAIVANGGSAEPAVEWQWVPVVQKTESEFPLASLAPMVLILMTITGAVYPAIDLTAGERERGTLEALMAAPVPRMSLLAAKYVAVLTVALLTAVANLVAMSVTLRGTGLGAAFLGPQGLSLTVLLQIFLLLGLFAAFFSAVLLAITCFARSFKEAQAYVIPLILLSLGPGFVSVIPGLKLGGMLAVAPLVNIVLLARDVMQGVAEPLPAIVAVLATGLYAIAALAVAARIFGSDSVLYGSQGSWEDVFRRPEQPQPQATVGGAWLAAALVYPVYFAAMGFLAAQSEQTVAWQIGLAVVCSIAIFGAIPWIVARRQHVSLVTGFQLGGPPILSLVGAAILGVSLWPLAHELFVIAQQIGIGSVSEETLRRIAPQLELRLEEWRKLSPAVILAAFALTPAVMEEFFFRGYLLGALRRHWPAWGAIGATALLFGLFHLSVGGLAAVERVVSSTFLGVVLGWICWRTGSIWPGVVTHTLHNGLLLSMAYWRDLLPGGNMVVDSHHLPASFIAGGLFGTAVGGGIVYLATSSLSARATDSSTKTPSRLS